MKKETIIFLVIIFILVLTCGMLLFLNFSNSLKFKTISSEKEKLDLKITQLEALVGSLDNRPNYQTPNVPQESNKKCTFTVTLQYIDTINYEGQGRENFALFSEFQGSKPIILKFESDFKTNFEYNKNYEITFIGNIESEEDLINCQVTSYKQTSKVGLDQIQESCDRN